MEIVFLGSGGGRMVLSTQARSTGGILIKTDNHQIHIDPGPGALLKMKMLRQDPRRTNVVLLSHYHTDHSGDMEGISEAVNEAVLISIKECLIGDNKVINEFYKKFYNEIIEIIPKKEIELSDLKITGTKTIHGDKSIGFIIETEGKKIGYMGDTGYFKTLSKQFEGVDLLIINVLRPNNAYWKNHLTTNEVIKILDEIKEKPKSVIITHFGLKMLRVGPLNQARRISLETKVPCRSAEDGMKILLEDVLEQTSLFGRKFKT